MKNLAKGTKLEVSKGMSCVFIATVKATFSDYYLCIDSRNQMRYVYEGEFVII